MSVDISSITLWYVLFETSHERVPRAHDLCIGGLSRWGSHLFFYYGSPQDWKTVPMAYLDKTLNDVAPFPAAFL